MNQPAPNDVAASWRAVLRRRTDGPAVLVVDDEPQIGSLVSEVLTRYGYVVLFARSGEEALRLWKRERKRIRLIIVDVVMPGMDGPELVLTLARTGADVPVLYMSAYPRERIPHQDPRTAFIEKPLSLEALLEQVRLLVGSQPVDPAPVAREARGLRAGRGRLGRQSGCR